MDFNTVGFDWVFFFLSLILSFIPFVWLRIRPLREKLYVLPYAIFFFIYSGVGVAWDNCDKEYLLYYFIWMLFFSLTLFLIICRKKIVETEGLGIEKVSWVINRADFFIVLYIFILFISVCLNGNLANLISPQAPDLIGVMDSVSEGDDASESGIIYYLKHILFVFYFVSLYKYRKKPFTLLFIIVLPFYLNYANTNYLARSTVMGYLLVYLVAVYFYNPHLRRKIRLTVSIGLPFVMVGLALYTFIRVGHDIDISATDAMKLLAYQETSYPTQYGLIKKTPFDVNLLKDYWDWVISLPLPGFLKDSSKDYLFNAIFTERLYGVIRGSMGFSIALPGIVGEGLFIFGPYLYILHAILLGIFVGITYHLVNSKKEFFIFLYMGIFMAFHSARAGTVSTYSMYLKDFLVYEIIILIVAFNTRSKLKSSGRIRRNTKDRINNV